MSVTSVITNIQYVNDGLNTVFPVPFYFVNQEDLLVQGTSPIGQLFTYGLNSDYLISGVPNLIGDYFNGANVVFNVAPGVNFTINIQRISNRTQEVQFFNGGPVTAETLNHVFDKLTLLMQEGFISGYKGVALGPPSTGVWNQGDWFKNISPIPGDVFGWIYTVSGGVGAWAAFGLISLLS